MGTEEKAPQPTPVPTLAPPQPNPADQEEARRKKGGMMRPRGGRRSRVGY
jgi:hypothetical protein